MQVSDLLTQYQNNLSSGSEVSTKTKGIEQLVETVKQLKTGNIFEGTVNSIRGTQVILGLSSGQNITARLDAGLSLSKGQSVFFQVKSNDGEQIRIKPISMGAGQGNPTLMQALDAASLAVSERNLNMVNAMMKEGMSIDSKSLQNMAKQIGSVPGSQPETIVQMQKLQLPIDANSVEQFENYKADRRQVLSQVQDLVAALGESFLDDAVDTQTMVGQNNRLVAFFGDLSMQEAFATGEAVYAEEMLPAEGQESVDLEYLSQRAGIFSQTLEDMDAYEAGTLGNSLDQGTFADLQNVLGQMPSFIKEHANFFTAEGQLLPQTKVDAFLQEVSVFLGQNAGRLSKESVQDLLRSKGYQKLFSDLVTKEWTVAPQDLPKEHSISHLYEKMSQQIHDLEQLADKFPSAKETIQGTANSLSQNIEFMNQLSQIYSYVQVPIRLRGQNVNSELFVYRNGGRDKGADDELTAFLHFDMDNLGGVDISVKMIQKNVSANWYLEDADSLTLLEENMHLLTERLEKKGYTCSMKLEQDAKKIDFVEDFLKADQKSSGEVHRYSFDVRA